MSVCIPIVQWFVKLYLTNYLTNYWNDLRSFSVIFREKTQTTFFNKIFFLWFLKEFFLKKKNTNDRETPVLMLDITYRWHRREIWLIPGRHDITPLPVWMPRESPLSGWHGEIWFQSESTLGTRKYRHLSPAPILPEKIT